MSPKHLAHLLTALGLLMVPTAAHATHDIGRGHHLLRVADSGAALVAACDVQVSEPPLLSVLARSGRVLQALSVPPGDRLSDALCGDPASLEALLPELPEVAAAIARHRLVHVPVVAPTSPDGRHHLFVAGDHTRADVELLAAGRRRPARTDRLRARPGIASNLFGLYVAWHPDGRYAWLVGQVADGVVPSCQRWRPSVRVYRVPRSDSAPLEGERIADRYLQWARARTARCARRHDVDACAAAEAVIRRALAIAPRYPAAQRALDAIPWP